MYLSIDSLGTVRVVLLMILMYRMGTLKRDIRELKEALLKKNQQEEKK
jgi:hypothetical protein